MRLRAKSLGIRRIEGHEKGGFVEFSDSNHVDPAFLIGLLQKQPQRYKLDGPSKLKFSLDLSERPKRLTFISELLEQFEQHRLS
ncbi:Transcription-repair-coupling factor [Leminorella richardii]|uniref:Transcription-repair-coupling factor n=1 Tax=Leminorella richardii TaxID=158841 RepID=A0A2X4V556_9GAMM|nr:Transcription-repair-coupling factor [Leminorella richardii]